MNKMLVRANSNNDQLGINNYTKIFDFLKEKITLFKMIEKLRDIFL